MAWLYVWSQPKCSHQCWFWYTLPAAQHWTSHSHCLFGSLVKEYWLLWADACAYLAWGRQRIQNFEFNINKYISKYPKTWCKSWVSFMPTGSKHPSSSSSCPQDISNNWHCSLLSQSTLAPAYAPALEGFQLILRWHLVYLICISPQLTQPLLLASQMELYEFFAEQELQKPCT